MRSYAGTEHNYRCACISLPCQCDAKSTYHVTGPGKVGIGILDSFKVYAHCTYGALGKVKNWMSKSSITCGNWVETDINSNHAFEWCNNKSWVYKHYFNISSIQCIKEITGAHTR